MRLLTILWMLAAFTFGAGRAPADGTLSVTGTVLQEFHGWGYPPAERDRLRQAARELGNGEALFVGRDGLTTESLRQAARLAGVHLFTATDCNVYANGPFIAVHASQDGPLVINTGSNGLVTDVLTCQIIGAGPELTLPIKRGETRILQRQGPQPARRNLRTGYGSQKR